MVWTFVGKLRRRGRQCDIRRPWSAVNRNTTPGSIASRSAGDRANSSSSAHWIFPLRARGGHGFRAFHRGGGRDAQIVGGRPQPDAIGSAAHRASPTPEYRLAPPRSRCWATRPQLGDLHMSPLNALRNAIDLDRLFHLEMQAQTRVREKSGPATAAAKAGGASLPAIR